MVNSKVRITINNIKKSEANILLHQLASAPSDCDLMVVGHGLDRAAELRATNDKRKDLSGEKLKCSDCKKYKLLNQFLKPDKLESLGATDFAKYMDLSMRGRMRCLICATKRRNALDRAMGRTIQMIQYGISAPKTKVISSLWRMNQFVSPEVVKQRNIVLARKNSNMKQAAMAKFNKNMLM